MSKILLCPVCGEKKPVRNDAKVCSDKCRVKKWRKGDKMLTLKIGRNEYDITENDKFMDNGACIQLMTQNKNNTDNWGQHQSPVLSKRAEKELKGFLRSQHEHNYGANIEVFSISAV